MLFITLLLSTYVCANDIAEPARTSNIPKINEECEKLEYLKSYEKDFRCKSKTGALFVREDLEVKPPVKRKGWRISSAGAEDLVFLDFDPALKGRSLNLMESYCKANGSSIATIDQLNLLAKNGGLFILEGSVYFRNIDPKKIKATVVSSSFSEHKEGVRGFSLTDPETEVIADPNTGGEIQKEISLGVCVFRPSKNPAPKPAFKKFDLKN